MPNEFDTPQSRVEAILQNILGAENELPPPKSRIEYYLLKILEEGISGLPDVTAADNGKVLGVVDGAWGIAVDGGLPPVTSADNGKFMCVTNGAWGAVLVPAAEGQSF